MTQVIVLFQVGQQLGEALLILTASGLPIQNIVLVGMSLGAHVCGQAGYYVQIHLGTSLDVYGTYLLMYYRRLKRLT